VNRVTLLGPQDEQPTVGSTVDGLADLDNDTPVALVTSGREGREAEDDDITSQLSRTVVNLSLFARSEAIFRTDTRLFLGLRRRHDQLRQLQALYRLRLDHALDAALAVLQTSGHPRDDWLVLERLEDRSAGLTNEIFEEAMSAVRDLDQQHLLRIRQVQAEFDEKWDPTRRDEVASAREEIATELSDCGALLIAGGHVTVLLNRLRLFGLIELSGDRPLVAWSAGAMALTPQVVAFHDSPPQGRGYAEVLESGLGLVPGLVALPHASRRLLLDDEMRVSVLARRMAPAVCLTLEAGSRADWNGTAWRAAPGTSHLAIDGTVPYWSPS